MRADADGEGLGLTELLNLLDANRTERACPQTVLRFHQKLT